MLHCCTRLDAWGRVQIAGQVPQRLQPAWKTTDPAPSVKTVIPLWVWLVVAAGVLVLLILGCGICLCLGLRRKRREEAAAAAAAAMGNAPPGWVVAEPVLPDEQHHRGGTGRSKAHRSSPRSSAEQHEQRSNGMGRHSRYASNSGWYDGGETATVPSTPLTPSSRAAPRTPPRSGGNGYQHRQRSPAHLSGGAAWGQGTGEGPSTYMRGSTRHVSNQRRSRTSLDHERQPVEGGWVHGDLPRLPGLPDGQGYGER
jgi:hypothetical protein